MIKKKDKDNSNSMEIFIKEPRRTANNMEIKAS